MLAGLMDVSTGGGFRNVSVALADLVGSATLVAVTNSLFGEGMFRGAMNRPVVSIVPTCVLPLICPATDHVTAVFAVPVTVAVNCCDAPVTRFALVGEIVILMLELGALSTTVTAFETAEPGFGFVTVTGTLPACAAVAVPLAVNCVGDTNVVASAVPPKFTTAPLTKFVPITSKVNAPMVSAGGVTETMVGTGFCNVTAAVPELVVSAILVAVTLIALLTGNVAGAL